MTHAKGVRLRVVGSRFMVLREMGEEGTRFGRMAPGEKVIATRCASQIGPFLFRGAAPELLAQRHLINQNVLRNPLGGKWETERASRSLTNPGGASCDRITFTPGRKSPGHKGFANARSYGPHSLDLSGRGTTSAEGAEGTPTQRHVSLIILVYEDKIRFETRI